MNMGEIGLEELMQILHQMPTRILHFLLRLIVAVVVVFVAWKLINALMRLLRRSLMRAGADAAVINFGCTFASVALRILLFFFVAAGFGVNTAGIIAIVGSAGVAIGLALQGSLSNLAGGVMILLLRPFRIGDYIKEDAHGHEGTVREISLFTTKLSTYDNKIIVLPNGDLANTSLTNMTGSVTRLLEIKVGVAYDTDLDHVKRVLESVVDAFEEKIEDEPRFVYVDSLGESAVIMGVRCWVPNVNYLQQKWSMNERIKRALDREGIVIPYPQVDVHLQREAKGIE